MVKDPLRGRKILQHLGLHAEGYDPLPARAPPHLDLAPQWVVHADPHSASICGSSEGCSLG